MNKILLAFTFLTVTILTIKGQQKDSLMLYLELAAKNNPAVLQKWAEYEASLQKIPQASSLPDPELSMGIFLSPMEIIAGKQVADIRLMQMFPWFGVLQNAKDEMSLMAQARYENFRDTKSELFYEVRTTWNELQKIEQSINISQENLELLLTIERLSLVKLKTGGSFGQAASSAGGPSAASAEAAPPGGMAGMSGNSANVVSPSSSGTASMSSSAMAPSGNSGLSDVYRIRIEISELENNILLLRDQKQSVMARFNSYLNRNPMTPVHVTGTLSPDSIPGDESVAVDSMSLHHPMLGMLSYERQSLEARKRMVTGMGFPMVGIGLNYAVIGNNEMSTAEMNGKDMIMPMVTVTLPIYRKKYKSMKEEVRLQETATTKAYEAMKNGLQVEIYEAFQQFRDAGRKMALYQDQAELAQKSLNILMKSYSSSGTGLTDLLRVQQQLLDYGLKHMEAVTANNTSIALINRLMATTSKD